MNGGIPIAEGEVPASPLWGDWISLSNRLKTGCGGARFGSRCASFARWCGRSTIIDARLVRRNHRALLDAPLRHLPDHFR